METLVINFPNDGKKMRRFITALLKSGSANEIKKLNYCSSYTIQNDKINKQEEKILIIFFDPNNKSKLENMIKKLHPEPNFFQKTI